MSAVYDLEVSKYFGTYEDLVLFKNLCEFYPLFFYDFLLQKCFDTSRPKLVNTFRPKYVDSSCNQNI